MADEREKTIRIYRDSRGRCPYLDWFVALRDNRAKQKIQARLARVRLGNLGHTNSVGEGVQELKIDFARIEGDWLITRAETVRTLR